MKFHTKLKTTSMGNNTFLFIPHKTKKFAMQQYSDIRFRPDSSFDIRFRPDFKNCYPVHPYQQWNENYK